MGDHFPDDNWALPLNADIACVRALECTSLPLHTSSLVDIPFVTKQTSAPFIISHLSRNAFLPENAYPGVSQPDWTFTGTDVSALGFLPGVTVDVDDWAWTVEGVELREALPGQPWAGIRVHDPEQDGAGGELTLGPGTVVSGVSSVYGAVRAYTASRITLDGAEILSNPGGPGVVSRDAWANGAPGIPAHVIITGDTQISGHAGAGVLAQNGGFVEIDGVPGDNGLEIFGNSVGIEAKEGGARVLMTSGTVRNNTGPGVRAAENGTVDLWSGYGDTGTPSLTTNAGLRVQDNDGGLYAETAFQGGGTITTASNVVCVKEPCPYTVTGQIGFEDNRGTTSDALYDMVASKGSYVDATENWWDTTDPAEVEFPASDTNRISYLPILTAPPSASGSTASSKTGSTFRGGGPDFTGVALAVATADRLRLGNGPREAAQALLGAFASADTDDERALVTAGAGRLLRRAETGALLAWAAQAASLPGTERPWARRALAEALLTRGETSAARDVAEALVADSGETGEGHLVAGLTLGLRVALGESDQAAAELSLGALAEVDAELAAELAVMAAASLGEIELRPGAGSPFPDAGKTGGALGTATLAVWPNPTTGALRLSVAAGATEVALFDVLGRRVATLYNGEAGAPLELHYDGAALAPGVYVVRVRSETGVTARTVTVAR